MSSIDPGMLFLVSLAIIIVGVAGKLLLDKWKQEPVAMSNVKLVVDNQEGVSISKLYSTVKGDDNEFYISTDVMNKYFHRGNFRGELLYSQDKSVILRVPERFSYIQDDNVGIWIKVTTEGDKFKVTATPYGPKGDIAKELMKAGLVDISLRALVDLSEKSRNVKTIVTFDLARKVDSENNIHCAYIV